MVGFLLAVCRKPFLFLRREVCPGLFNRHNLLYGFLLGRLLRLAGFSFLPPFLLPLPVMCKPLFLGFLFLRDFPCTRLYRCVNFEPQSAQYKSPVKRLGAFCRSGARRTVSRIFCTVLHVSSSTMAGIAPSKMCCSSGAVLRVPLISEGFHCCPLA